MTTPLLAGCSSSETLLKRSAPGALHTTSFWDNDLTGTSTSHKPFIIPIFLPHAGCPHRCVFCNQSSITGVNAKHSGPDVRNIVETFLRYKSTGRKGVQIAFYGGNFLGIRGSTIEHLLAEAAGLVKEGRVDSIRFSTRPDTIDRRRLDLISRFPVATIELGVQSMSDRVLAGANRGHSSADTQKAIRRLKELHYEIGVQLMVGLPGDNPGSLLASARQVARLKPHFIRIYPTVVLAGSPLAIRYKKGDYVPLSLEEAVTRVKDLYLFFKNENIPVIRMGLQANEDLAVGSTLLAGPFHPAFGHLVYSDIFLDMAVSALKSKKRTADSIAIKVHPRSISKMRGLHNRNIAILKNKFEARSISIEPFSFLSEQELVIL